MPCTKKNTTLADVMDEVDRYAAALGDAQYFDGWSSARGPDQYGERYARSNNKWSRDKWSRVDPLWKNVEAIVRRYRRES